MKGEYKKGHQKIASFNRIIWDYIHIQNSDRDKFNDLYGHKIGDFSIQSIEFFQSIARCEKPDFVFINVRGCFTLVLGLQIERPELYRLDLIQFMSSKKQQGIFNSLKWNSYKLWSHFIIRKHFVRFDRRLFQLQHSKRNWPILSP